MSTELKTLLKWAWSFSPALWIFLLSLLAPGVTALAAKFDNGFQYFSMFVLVWICEFILFGLGILAIGFWTSVLKPRIEEWWDERPFK